MLSGSTRQPGSLILNNVDCALENGGYHGKLTSFTGFGNKLLLSYNLRVSLKFIDIKLEHVLASSSLDSVQSKDRAYKKIIYAIALLFGTCQCRTYFFRLRLFGSA